MTLLPQDNLVSGGGGSEDAGLISKHSRDDVGCVFLAEELGRVGFELLDCLVFVVGPVAVEGGGDGLAHLFVGEGSGIRTQLDQIHDI